jgi:hypothetical protein
MATPDRFSECHPPSGPEGGGHLRPRSQAAPAVTVGGQRRRHHRPRAEPHPLGPFDHDEKDETLTMLHEQTTEILARLILDLTQTLARTVT